jgi:hypothetical protein
VELEGKRDEFARQGLRVASVSYDSVAVLKAFAGRTHISYPMLSDPDSRIIRDFGILNEEVPAGTLLYGIPYPGTYVVDPHGVVRGKFFEPDYRERYTAGSILLKASPAATLRGWAELQTPHLKLRYRASDNTVHGGSRATLLMEVSLKPKMHVYAPGVRSSYIPIKWEMASGAWKAGEARWPASKMLRLPAIGETVPVYEGLLATSREITFSQQKELLAAAGEARQVSVESTFRYQACDDKQCYQPVEVPLKYTFGVETLDFERAPQALRRK